MVSLVNFNRGQRIQWLGHMWRHDEDNIKKVVLDWKPTGKRSQGWPKKRWLDIRGFEDDRSSRLERKIEGFSDDGETLKEY